MWQQVITLLGGTALCLAAVAWLVRSIINHFLARDIESYKTKLVAASEAEAERLKTDLQKIAYEHQITFGKLHSERAEVIKSLHSKLMKLRDLVFQETTMPRPVGQREVNAADSMKPKIIQLWDEFGEEFTQKRIFLSVHLCKEIEFVSRSVMTPIFFSGLEEDPAKASEELWVQLRSVNQLSNDLENEFRTILGVK